MRPSLFQNGRAAGKSRLYGTRARRLIGGLVFVSGMFILTHDVVHAVALSAPPLSATGLTAAASQVGH